MRIAEKEGTGRKVKPVMLDTGCGIRDAEPQPPQL
jgi:hypothetical protein